MQFRRSENLNSIYILLFLNIAFFFLQIQDFGRYAQLFAFERSLFLGGQYWRILTYQFVQGGDTIASQALSLFFNLLILYYMGSAVEEENGTRDFLLYVLLSLFGSAGVAFFLGIPLLGSFFVSFSLLFIFGTMFPEQTVFLIVFPVKVKWLAYLGAGYLLFQVLMRNPVGISALGGAALSYGYFYIGSGRFRPMRLRATPHPGFVQTPVVDDGGGEALRNRQRFDEMKRTLAADDPEKVGALIAKIQPDIVPGVNICPPADYKPEAEDGYCVRCEGFAECSVRYLKMKTGKAADVGTKSS